MHGWCSGAPGIGLARLSSAEIVAQSSIDVERAARATVAAGLGRRDHLCCGNLGRAAFLVEAARHFDDRDLYAAAAIWSVRLSTAQRPAARSRWSTTTAPRRITSASFRARPESAFSCCGSHTPTCFPSHCSSSSGFHRPGTALAEPIPGASRGCTRRRRHSVRDGWRRRGRSERSPVQPDRTELQGPAAPRNDVSGPGGEQPRQVGAPPLDKARGGEVSPDILGRHELENVEPGERCPVILRARNRIDEVLDSGKGNRGPHTTGSENPEHAGQVCADISCVTDSSFTTRSNDAAGRVMALRSVVVGTGQPGPRVWRLRWRARRGQARLRVRSRRSRTYGRRAGEVAVPADVEHARVPSPRARPSTRRAFARSRESRWVCTSASQTP